jgi:hypothetical protein
MDEPALDLTGLTLSLQKKMVRVFYKLLRDHADKSLIPTILHPDFTFRGSSVQQHPPIGSRPEQSRLHSESRHIQTLVLGLSRRSMRPRIRVLSRGIG